jgi:hypothetical protein
MVSQLEGEPEPVLDLAPSVLARSLGESEIATSTVGAVDDRRGALELRGNPVRIG